MTAECLEIGTEAEATRQSKATRVTTPMMASALTRAPKEEQPRSCHQVSASDPTRPGSITR